MKWLPIFQDYAPAVTAAVNLLASVAVLVQQASPLLHLQVRETTQPQSVRQVTASTGGDLGSAAPARLPVETIVSRCFGDDVGNELQQQSRTCAAPFK